jgi:hypothetical protein
MRVRLFVVFALAAAMPLTAASAMPVSTFLDKANRLEKKGPAALFSSDLKLLTRQIKADAAELRAENKAAEAARRRKAYCTPAGGVKLSNRDILEAMNAVPPAQRASTQTKEAMRSYFARRFPCSA